MRSGGGSGERKKDRFCFVGITEQTSVVLHIVLSLSLSGGCGESVRAINKHRKDK